MAAFKKITELLSQLPVPGDRVIDLWFLDMSCTEPFLDELSATLSKDERARAGRFYFDQHRCRFIAAHGFLRLLLSGYLGVGPESLIFHYGANGKPELSLGRSRASVYFNHSRSGTGAIFGIHALRPLGVDMELVDEHFEFSSIVDEYFHPTEKSWIDRQPAARKRAAFYRLWTMKESLVKATGEGVSGLSAACFRPASVDGCSFLVPASDHMINDETVFINSPALHPQYEISLAVLSNKRNFPNSFRLNFNQLVLDSSQAPEIKTSSQILEPKLSDF